MRFYKISFLALMLSACTQPRHEGKLFTLLSPRETGIDFTNTITEDDSTSSFIDEFGYMGGGVGIGDFNKDGLPDIFFTGNQTSCRLYLNKGDHHFEDITIPAGLTTHVWATGVSIVDIDGDGYDDIYVCVFGKNLQQRAANLLFINQHDNTFKEMAADYGLADTGYSTQALFLDYDHDGDLDMYLTNYLLNGPNANTVYPKDLSGLSPANDRLFRNDGDAGLGHPVFKDVSQSAGIRDCGYGLGVVASDLNGDGWPDIYVADDFVSDDLCWINNRNGTFTDRLKSSLPHTSYSSMGVDAADINNDGRPDIVTLDMLPEFNTRRKLTFSFMNYERYELERSMGYTPQFMRNMLQLNNGIRNSGDTILPYFSEIGRYAGISATDWSWSVLLADFDNDGWKDMHITNGIGRDFINADFLEFSGSIFSGPLSPAEQRKRIRDKLASLKHIELPNYLYLNNKDCTFADASATAGIDPPSMSNGAAYVDLDNDGDLDLVVNNIDAPAFVFINNARQGQNPANYLAIDLKGNDLNRHAFGARLQLFTGSQQQTLEQNPVRGYFSSVDQRLFFGLGGHTRADSLLITWPDGKRQTIKNIRADTTLTIREQPMLPASPPEQPIPALFTDITPSSQAGYRHLDVPFNDYTIQRLLPQKFSQQGPYIATGDIDGDGLTDFFIGGGFNSSGKIFLQNQDGHFTAHNLSDSIKMQEDEGVALFDADGDGDLDLLISCGDTRFPEGSPYLTPRMYANDGKGKFTLLPSAIPPGITTIAGPVSIADYDGDGQPDIFIGGRISATYPLSPRSYLLHNDHGKFTDVTKDVCSTLQNPGMITAATWADLDGDKRPDLVLAGEWMPIRIFMNDQGRLRETTRQHAGLPDMNGMWRCLAIADMDGDGDPDIIAGNLGLNCDYRTDSAHPARLFAKDLDANGSMDPIPFYDLKDENGARHPYPAISRAQFAKQVPSIKRRFLYNQTYAQAGIDEIFSTWNRDGMLNLTCTETRSGWLENTGQGHWKFHPLPAAAQLAPINAILCHDFDGDGHMDLLLAGNEYQTEPMTGRYDASYGCLLRSGTTPVPGAIILDGDVRSLALLPDAKGHQLILAGINNDSLKIFRNSPPPKNREPLASYSPAHTHMPARSTALRYKAQPQRKAPPAAPSQAPSAQ